MISHSPEFLLNLAKRMKKGLRRNALRKQEKTGGLSLSDLQHAFHEIGIQEGDSLLVHSSLSKIGFVQGGAATVIRALLNVLGTSGTLLMPSFPASGRNKDYLESGAVFDVRHTPSAMGIISETFRQQADVKRSLHPTDPVCAYGPLAEYYTQSHFGQLTPYNEHSPFRKLSAQHGKILMLGTTLNGAGTSLHCLEDAVEFKYPVYTDKIYNIEVINEDGNKLTMQTRVHNPEWSAKRNCDALLPLFKREGVIRCGKTGQAETLLIDAGKLLEVMLQQYRDNGVTMYTPYGEKKTIS